MFHLFRQQEGWSTAIICRRRLFLFQGDDVGFIRPCVPDGLHLAKEHRRYIQMLSVIGNDSDRLPVVSGQHPEHGGTTRGLKGHAIAILKFQHPAVRTHLIEKTKPLHNSTIEVKELSASVSSSMSILIGLPP